MNIFIVTIISIIFCIILSGISLDSEWLVVAYLNLTVFAALWFGGE